MIESPLGPTRDHQDCYTLIIIRQACLVTEGTKADNNPTPSNMAGHLYTFEGPILNSTDVDGSNHAGMLPNHMFWMPAFGTFRTAYLHHCSRRIITEEVSGRRIREKPSSTKTRFLEYGKDCVRGSTNA